MFGVWIFSLLLRWSCQNESTDLQAEQELLALSVMRAEFDQFQLESHRVSFHVIEKAAHVIDRARSLDAALNRGVFVRLMFRLRADGGDGHAAVPLPFAKCFEHLFFGERFVRRQSVCAITFPGRAQSVLAINHV